MENNIRFTRQSGNVLFLILIAAAMFAALSFTIMKSVRSGSNDGGGEKARLVAADILNQATAVQTAVSRLILGECQAIQLSFENNLDSEHVNPGAPANKKCHVFDLAGGGAVARLADAKAIRDRHYYFIGSASLTGIGQTCANATCADLTLQLRGISPIVCEQLNALYGWKIAFADIPTETQTGCPFQGSFDCSGNGTTEVIFSNPQLSGRQSVCYKDSANGPTFSHVILAR